MAFERGHVYTEYLPPDAWMRFARLTMSCARKCRQLFVLGYLILDSHKSGTQIVNKMTMTTEDARQETKRPCWVS